MNLTESSVRISTDDTASGTARDEDSVSRAEMLWLWSDCVQALRANAAPKTSVICLRDSLTVHNSFSFATLKR